MLRRSPRCDGHLVHDLDIGGTHQVVTFDHTIPATATTRGFRTNRTGVGPLPHGVGTLFIEGEAAGSMETHHIFWLMISWSDLDIGLDRGSTVADVVSSHIISVTVRVYAPIPTMSPACRNMPGTTCAGR